MKIKPTPENELLRKEARNRHNALLKQQPIIHEKKLRRKVPDYSKGSKGICKNYDKCGNLVHTAFDKTWPDLHALA